MTDRTVDGMRACISSLDKIIAPAVKASGDSLAMEQVALLSKYLDFLTQRVPHTEERSRRELGIALSLGSEMDELITERLPRRPDRQFAEALATLRAEAQGAARLLDLAVPPRELEAASGAVRTAISRVVRLLPSLGDTALTAAARTLVVNSARGYVDLQRAWFAPQQWENDASAVPDLDTLLSGAPAVPKA